MNAVIEKADGLCDKCNGATRAKVRVGKDDLRLEFCGSCYQRRAHALFLAGFTVKSSPTPYDNLRAAKQRIKDDETIAQIEREES